jgi:hypothetical protein
MNYEKTRVFWLIKPESSMFSVHGFPVEEVKSASIEGTANCMEQKTRVALSNWVLEFHLFTLYCTSQFPGIHRHACLHYTILLQVTSLTVCLPGAPGIGCIWSQLFREINNCKRQILCYRALCVIIWEFRKRKCSWKIGCKIISK